MSDGGWRLGRRPALDGLRGVAILLVLAHHARVPGFGSAGVVGVTVFFALSGFLITGLLLEERAWGRVNLRRFYVHRARRLLPAAAVLIAAVACARLILGPWVAGWSTFPAVIFYGANFVPAKGGDLGAFGAMWTLAVEEQFYLVWPLLVVAAVTRSRVIVLASVLAAGSVLARVWLLADGAGYVRIYVGSETVAFALLVGAVTVGLRLGGGPGRASSTVRRLAILGLFALVVPQQPWLVLTFLAAAVVTCVILWHSTGVGSVVELEVKVLRWFGLRSYGIYLWHAPILWAMADHYRLPWPVLVVVGVPVSLGLAELSYRFVEAPFRARNQQRVEVRQAVAAV